MTQDRTPSAELVALLHRVRTTAGKSTFVLSDPAAMKLIDAYAAQVSAERVKAERERVAKVLRECVEDNREKYPEDPPRLRQSQVATAEVERLADLARALTDDTAPQEKEDMASKPASHTFVVDGAEFKSDQPVLPGIKIKFISKTDGSHSLYLMEQGQTPDIAIGDSDTVNIVDRHFFTTPPGLIHG